MTLVVGWWDGSSLNVVADARISGGGAPLTDSGPKVLEVPVRSSAMNENERAVVTHEAMVGFAFSGSTLPAMCTHALASACTIRLVSDFVEPPPSLEYIATIFQRVGQHYIEDINSRRNGGYALFDAFLFGYCPVKSRHLFYRLFPVDRAGAIKLELEEIKPIKGQAYALGSGRDAFEAVRQENMQASPLEAFHDTVRRNLRADVGGASQRAIVFMQTCVLIPVIYPIDEATKESRTSFLGFDLNRLRMEPYDVGYVAEHPPTPGSEMPPGIWSRVPKKRATSPPSGDL